MQPSNQSQTICVNNLIMVLMEVIDCYLYNVSRISPNPVAFQNSIESQKRSILYCTVPCQYVIGRKEINSHAYLV